MRTALRTVALIALAGATLAAPGSASAASERIAGVNAVPGRAAVAAGTLVVQPHSALAARLEMFETAAGNVVRTYDVDMTQLEHMIVIGDDFRSFQHLHPALGRDGHFRIDVRVPRAGRYYVYCDTEPHGLGQHVFRFPVTFGHAPLRRPDLAPTAATVPAHPYSVSLDTLSLRARRTTMLRVKIAERGRPAVDLRPYLGSAAHAIFIETRTLAYVHVHPVVPGRPDMPAMPGMAMQAAAPLPRGASVGPTMELHIPATAAGRYRLWLQFRGADGLHVAPFVLIAR